MKPIVVLSFIVLVISACKKPENRPCWKTAGEETELTIAVEPFTKMFLKEHVEFVLVQDTIEKVVDKLSVSAPSRIRDISDVSAIEKDARMYAKEVLKKG